MINQIQNRLKYLKIAEFIQKGITKGDFLPGQQIPTQNELSAYFKTSRPTIEKALDGLEEKGLIIRKKGAGTFVSGKIDIDISQTKFGFLAPRPPLENDFEHNFINMVFSRISNESKVSNFTLLSDTASFDDENRLLTHITDTCQKFINENIKGLFYVPVDFTENDEKINRTICEKLDNENIKIVLLDRDICQMPQRSKYDVIGINNRRASYRITNHLTGLGLKNIYFVSCQLNSNVIHERIEGYREAIAAANLKSNIVTNYNFKDTQQSTQRLETLMGQLPKPQGIVCINDEAASIIMRDALKLGICLPDELHIVGFDDLPTSGLLYCPLTTIKQPVEQIATQAVSRMCDRICNPNNKALDIYVKEELIIRES